MFKHFTVDFIFSFSLIWSDLFPLFTYSLTHSLSRLSCGVVKSFTSFHWSVATLSLAHSTDEVMNFEIAKGIDEELYML
jgi:hypothetical protein